MSSKAKKSTAELYEEALAGKRKSVPASAFLEVCIDRADVREKLKERDAQANECGRYLRKESGKVKHLKEEVQQLKEQLMAQSARAKQEKLTVTLRDQFAMAALQSMGSVLFAGETEDTVEIAYRLADAMLKARQ